MFSTWKRAANSWMRAHGKFCIFCQDLETPTTITYFPNSSAISLYSLEAAHDCNVIFCVPSQNIVWKGTLEKASSVGIRRIKSNQFYFYFLGQQNQSYERFFSNTHSFIWFPHTSWSQSWIFYSRITLTRGKFALPLIQILYYFPCNLRSHSF